SGLGSPGIQQVLEAQDGRYLVAADGGLARFDPVMPAPGPPKEKGKSPVFVPIPLPPGTDPTTMRLFEDHAGGLWVSSWNQLARLRMDGAIARFEPVQGLATPDVPLIVRSFLEDASGIWIATRWTGLFRLGKNGRIDHWTTNEGLSSREL